MNIEIVWHSYYIMFFAVCKVVWRISLYDKVYYSKNGCHIRVNIYRKAFP